MFILIAGSVLLAFGLVVVAACIVAGRTAPAPTLTPEERATLARAARVRADRTRMGLHHVLSRTEGCVMVCTMVAYRNRHGDLRVTPLGPAPNALDRPVEQLAGYL